jgi:cell division protein FtsL
MVQSLPPVRNRLLVRELDRRRLHELLLIVLLVGVLLLPLLTYVWYHMEWIRVGYEMEKLKQERGLQVELGARLRIEKASLESLSRVEREARDTLGLVPAGEAVVRMDELESPTSLARVSGSNSAGEPASPRAAEEASTVTVR